MAKLTYKTKPRGAWTRDDWRAYYIGRGFSEKNAKKWANSRVVGRVMQESRALEADFLRAVG